MTDNVALSVRQFTEAWKILCARFPGHARHEEDGVACIFSGSPIAFFNVAFVMGRDVTADALADRARRATDWAGARGVPWMLVVTQEALSPGVDAPATLDGAGLAPVMTLTGMLADEVATLATVPAGLELEVPRDDESRGRCQARTASRVHRGASRAPVDDQSANKPRECARVSVRTGRDAAAPRTETDPRITAPRCAPFRDAAGAVSAIECPTLRLATNIVASSNAFTFATLGMVRAELERGQVVPLLHDAVDA